MEKINWKIEGMTCNHCVLRVQKYLENEGLSNVQIDLPTGNVSFTKKGNNLETTLTKGIEDLGYRVVLK